MSDLYNLIMNAISPDRLNSISTKVGETPAATKSVIEQALPLIIGALAQRGTSNETGFEFLNALLDKNQDGSILDDVIRMVTSSGDTPQNAAALGVLAAPNQQDTIAEHVQHETGVHAGAVAKILPMLAPIVIGALAKVQVTQQLDQASLEKFLEKEREEVAGKSPAIQDTLTALFDANGDGSMMDDLMKKGSGILGKLLS